MTPQDLPELSLDLVEAARRSESALAQIDDAARQLVLERYKKFLWLAKRYPKEHLAPASDIDEMWHLHMMNPRAYVRDCEHFFGGILDHDGGFGQEPHEAPILREVFEATAKLYEQHFGEPYVPEIGSGIRTCFREALRTCFRVGLKTCWTPADA